MRSSDLRRMMMAQKHGLSPGGEIVTDGLIFRLNGLNVSGNKWVDEVGGIEFPDVSPAGVGIQLIKNAPTPVAQAAFKTTGTLEFCFRDKADGDYAIIASSPAGSYVNGWAVASYGAKLITGNGWGERMPMYQTDLRKQKNATASFSRASGFVNKAEVAQAGVDHWGAVQSNRTCLGNKSTDDLIVMNTLILCEVRIYDRILTEAEILQNQQYDIDTYFGGVIPK